MDSCPKELEPYELAENERIKKYDYLAWLFSQYTLSAVSVAVEHNLAGMKAKSRYIEKPFMQETEIEKNGSTESQEEIAVFEMKLRTKQIRNLGLQESPE